MITYTTDDVIQIEDTPFAWRFSGEPWGTLSNAQRSVIFPLSEKRGKDIKEAGRVLRQSYPPIVNTSLYRVISETSLEDEHDVLCWLTFLPIIGSEGIYISWGDDQPVATAWDIFIQLWDDFWYPFDVVNIFDDTLQWAVLLGPEEWAVHIVRKGFGDAPDDANVGASLVQAVVPDHH